MPDWLNTVIFETYDLFKQVLKSRSIFSYLKDLGILGSKYRSGIMKDYNSDFAIERDEAGNEKTKFEMYLEKNPKVDSFFNSLSKGFKKFIDVATSPVTSRALFYLGAAVGIGLAASNPVSLGIAIAATAVSVGSVAYGMYGDVNRFRAQKKLQEERAILEEMMLLKTQNKAIAEQLFTKDESVLKKLGLSSISSQHDWQNINKKGLVATTFLQNLPSSTVPLIASLATGNFVGFGITLAGYFLDSCGGSARGIAYAKAKEKLLNANSSLANSLGIIALQHGQRNDDLNHSLASMRAQNQALIRAVTLGKSANPEETLKIYQQNLTEQLSNIDSLTTKTTKSSWWQDAKKVWYKDGTSYAKTFRNFNPMVNEYREEYRTNIEPHKLKKAIETMTVAASKDKNIEEVQAKHAELKKQLVKNKPRENLSTEERKALTQANLIKFNAEKPIKIKPKPAIERNGKNGGSEPITRG
jgi:hypothetical protein